MNETQIKKSYNDAANGSVDYVRKYARKIPRDHSNLDEFIMGMGIWFFTVKGADDHIPRLGSVPGYMRGLSEFIDEWDEYLKITGFAMRFTADGPEMNDW